MEEWILGIEKICHERQKAAIVSIIWTKKSSSPWRVGSKMIVYPGGQIVGSLGKGYLEQEARKEALKALAKERPIEVLVAIDKEVAGKEGKVCGGPIRLFIEIISFEEDGNYAIWQSYLEARKQKKAVIQATIVKGKEENLGRKMLIYPEGHFQGDLGEQNLNKRVCELAIRLKPSVSMVVSDINNGESGGLDEDVQLFLEVKDVSPEIVILGGGDISQILTTLAKLLGFKVVVVDQDPLFASQARFSEADAIICKSYDEYLAGMESNKLTYFVIMTRGHCHDRLCLEGVLNKKSAYIGMIGNPKRVKELMSELQAAGLPKKRLAEVRAPIGLELGAKTYQEIALSIIAEIVQAYRGRSVQLV